VCALDGGGYGVRRWWLWCGGGPRRRGAVVCAGPTTMVAVAVSGGRGGKRRARLEVGDNPDMWGPPASVRERRGEGTGCAGPAGPETSAKYYK